TAPLLMTGLYQALEGCPAVARPRVASISADGHRLRSGTLWRRDVVIASEQQFPDVGEATVTLADASGLAARVAGRDPGTNVIAFRLDGTADPPLLPRAEPRLGALAAGFGADET